MGVSVHRYDYAAMADTSRNKFPVDALASVTVALGEICDMAMTEHMRVDMQPAFFGKGTKNTVEIALRHPFPSLRDDWALSVNPKHVMLW